MIRSLAGFFALSLAAAAADYVSPVGHDHVLKSNRQEEERRQAWIGHWTGEASAEGGIYRWLVIRSADGTFYLHGRMYQGGVGVAERIEAGEWGLADGSYITKTDSEWDGAKFIPIDPSQPNLWGIYRIVGEQKDELTYRHEGLDKTYVVKRVGEKYELPEKG